MIILEESTTYKNDLGETIAEPLHALQFPYPVGGGDKKKEEPEGGEGPMSVRIFNITSRRRR